MNLSPTISKTLTRNEAILELMKAQEIHQLASIRFSSAACDATRLSPPMTTCNLYGWISDMRPAPRKPSSPETTSTFTPLPRELTDAQKVILGLGGF
jgi:hypothetical protein